MDFLIAVGIPCYNGAKYIKNCLESIIGQSHKPDEIIVVDDGSTDNSFEIISQYPIRIVKHEKNRGLAEVRNTIINSTKCNIIAFLDADCIADKNWLKNIVDNYMREPDIDGVGGIGIEANSRGIANSFRSKYCIQGHGDKSKYVDMLFGLCASYKIKSLINAGFFNSIFRTNGEDLDMGLRIRKDDGRLLYDPTIKVFHQREDTKESLLKMVGKGYYFGTLAFLLNKRTKFPFFLKSNITIAKNTAINMIIHLIKGEFSFIPLSVSVYFSQNYYAIMLLKDFFIDRKYIANNRKYPLI